MSSTTFKISFRNHNVGANSADGFRVYRKEGSDPCPVVGPDGLHIPDVTNLFHEEMGVDLTENWIDSSEISGTVSYFYRISFFRNNGVNPQKGAVSHERVDTMLLGPINASDASSLGYPNNFPSNLSGVPYSINEQPLIHLDPARTVKESAIAHEDVITSSTAVEYSGRGWVNMVPCVTPANAVFDLENILDANGAAVPCYRFANQVAGLATQQIGTAPYEGVSNDIMFCDEGWTVFVLMSPVPNGKAGFSTYNFNVNGNWVPQTGPNANSICSDNPLIGQIFEWSSQEIKYGGGVGTSLGPDLTSIPDGQSHLLRIDRNDTQMNNWMSAYHPAYGRMANTHHSYLSGWKGASRASAAPTGVMGTPPSFPHDPNNYYHWLSHLHLTTCRLSPIISPIPKYQGWINGGLPGGSVAVDTDDGKSALYLPTNWPLAEGLAQAMINPYFISNNWISTGNSYMLAGNGAYAEYLLFPKALSNAQMTTVGSYLNNKYALPNSIETFTGAEG
jgi:hypothetical protein